jgi:hypothetical protein
MPAMRTSLVARWVRHPSIDFGTGRRVPHRARLGLVRQHTVYHRPRHAMRAAPSVALRSETSRFRFPSVARHAGVPVRRHALPFGLTRARRA